MSTIIIDNCFAMKGNLLSLLIIFIIFKANQRHIFPSTLMNSVNVFLKYLYHYTLSSIMRKPFFFVAYAKTKAHMDNTVIEQLISTFVFPIELVQSVYILYLRCQPSSHLFLLYCPACIRSGRKLKTGFVVSRLI